MSTKTFKLADLGLAYFYQNEVGEHEICGTPKYLNEEIN